MEALAPEPAVTEPPGPVVRLGRRPRPWSFVPWPYAGENGCFNGRWDDPHGTYRVLYAAENRLAALLERLAQFRPDIDVLAGMAAIDGDSMDRHYPTAPAGVIPADFFDRWVMQWARVRTSCVDVRSKDTIAHLRVALAARVVHHGLADLDGGVLQAAGNHPLTREVSAYLYDRGAEGIAYESRHGDGLALWAVFEREGVEQHIEPGVLDELPADDPDLARAMEVHGLRLG